jgi:hypothetical protein
MRRAILNHAGEASAQEVRFEKLSREDQDCLIEFLKTLQVLPPGTPWLIVDESFQKKTWPAPTNLTRDRAPLLP